MSLHQPCRYKDTIELIPTRALNGQCYVYLQDIHDPFPDVSYFAIDGKIIPFEHDNNGLRLEPWRIQALEGEIIDCHASQPAIQHTTNADLMKQINERTDAILHQNFEMVEKKIPCHFIVFTEDTLKFNPADWLSFKYRLYFLCQYENGNRHHLAYHEGYELREPREFLKKYTPHLRKMLKVVKISLSISGLAALPLAQIDPDDFSSPLNENESPSRTRKLGIQLERLDAILTEVEKGFDIQTDDNIHHAVGPNCRALEYFLKKMDKRNQWGNLYRTSSRDGYIHWTCVRHWDTPAGEDARKSLCSDFQLLGGEIQGDIAIIQGTDLENSCKLVNIIEQGLSISSIVLQKIEIRRAAFEKFLAFISRQSLIHSLTIDNIIVKSRLRTMSQQTVATVLQLREAVEKNAKLSIHCTFMLPIERFETKLVDCLTNTGSRLVFQVQSIENENALELTGTSHKGFSLSLNKYDGTKYINYRKSIENLLRKVVHMDTIFLFGGDILKDCNERFDQFLKTNLVLQEITVNCRLTLEQIGTLSDVLSSNKTLKKLNIINIWEEKDQIYACNEILSAVKMNQNIVQLNLTHDDSLLPLHYVPFYLSENQNLQILKLSKCFIKHNRIDDCEPFFQNTSVNTLAFELLTGNCKTSAERLIDLIDKNKNIQIFELKGSYSEASFDRSKIQTSEIDDHSDKILTSPISSM